MKAKLAMIFSVGAIAIASCALNSCGVRSLVDPDAGKLTTLRAEQIVGLFLGELGEQPLGRNCSQTGNGRPYTVDGIHEVPAGNSARADIVFKDFTYGWNGCTQLTYSGRGTATFAHYNDGRWVLTGVEFDSHEWKFDQPKYASN